MYSAGNGLTITGTEFAIDGTVLVDGDIGSTVQAHSSVLDGTTASYTTAEKTKLSGIEEGATADQTASQILTAVKTVDGSGSGLDADLLDGYNSSQAESSNTVAVRNSNGHLSSSYFNGSGTFATSGGTSGMGLFTGTNGTDTFGRSYTAAAARTLLNVENGATADQTPLEILNAIKTVDGSGSGLDADLLDGQTGSYYYSPANAPDPTLTLSGDASGSATFTNLGNATLTVTVADDSHNHVISNVDGLQTALDAKAPLAAPSLTGDVKAVNMLAVGTAGTPRLTGQSDVIEIHGGTASFHMGVQDGSGRVQMRWNASKGTDPTYQVSNEPSARYEILDVTSVSDSLWKIDHADSGTAGSTIAYNNILSLGTTTFTYNGNTVWHAGNDGSGSGLDADLLDGQHGSYYTDITSRLGYTPVQQGGGAGQGTNKLYMGWSGSALLLQVDSTDFSSTWPISVTGDAGTVDGLNASQFIRSDATDTATGVITFSDRIQAHEIRTNTNQELILNAGESASYATGQTGEFVYVNAESGLQINTSPDNWSSGWAGRDTFTFSSSGMQFPDGTQQTTAATGGGGLEYVSSNLTLEAGGQYLVSINSDTTLTLPASPSTGDIVRILAASGNDSNTLTVARNGSTIETLTENLTVDTLGIDFILWYTGTTWSLI